MNSEENIRLDRIDIEEAGPNPERMASAIHDQLDCWSGPIPIHAIARALDIHEIRVAPLSNFEGALITPLERGFGSIVVNARSNRQRQRFTVAHELCHFLNPWHVPTDDVGFQCSRDDIQRGRWIIKPSLTKHQRQEAEANRFAIETLLPRSRLAHVLSGPPDLHAVLTTATECDVSRSAVARRYVELHDSMIAVAFSHQGRLRYWARPSGFPYTAIKSEDPMPELPQKRDGSKLTEMEEADPADWISRPDNSAISVQTLYQRNGYAMTLVVVSADQDDDKENDDLEDTFDRFSGFNS